MLNYFKSFSTNFSEKIFIKSKYLAKIITFLIDKKGI